MKNVDLEERTSTYFVASEQSVQDEHKFEKWWVTEDILDQKTLTDHIVSGTYDGSVDPAESLVAMVVDSDIEVRPSFKIIIPAPKKVEVLTSKDQADHGEPMVIDGDTEVHSPYRTNGSKSSGFPSVSSMKKQL